MVERSLLQQVGGVASAYAVRGFEDYATWLRIAAVTPWIAVPKSLVTYRDDPKNSLRGSAKNGVPETLVAQLDFLSWMRSTGYRPPVDVRLLKRAVSTGLQVWAVAHPRLRRLPANDDGCSDNNEFDEPIDC